MVARPEPIRHVNRDGSSSPARSTSGRAAHVGVDGASPSRGGDIVATFELTLRDGTVEVIEGADAYQQEGQMTTFFANASGRQIVDCWSTRLASFRTSEVVIIRRVDRVLAPRDDRTAASPFVAAELPNPLSPEEGPEPSFPPKVAELRSA
jgi:hypothetical protein